MAHFVLLFVALIALSGCAEGQKAYPGIMPNLSDAIIHSPGILVTIEYPVAVKEEAYPAFRKQWIKRQLQTGHRSRYKSRFDTEQATEGVIIEELSKAAFHATELYKALATVLPPNTVALQPRRVVQDTDGRLTYERSQDTIPAAIEIDFGISCSLYRAAEGRLWTPDTLGTDFTMRVAIFSGSRQGSIHDWCLAGTLSPYEFNGDIRTGTYLDLLHMSSDYKPVSGFSDSLGLVSDRRPVQPGRFFHLGWRNFSVDDQAVKQWVNSNGKTAYPFRSVMDLCAYVVVDILNQQPDLIRSATRRHVELYDPDLAAELANDRLSDVAQQRLALFTKIVDIERRFIGDQDVKFVDSLTEGVFGDAMRHVIEAELAFSRHAQAVQNQQMNQMLASGLMSLTSSTLAAQGHLSPQQNLAMQMQMLTSLSGQQQTQDAGLRELAMVYDRQFSRTLAAQQEYVAKIGEGEQAVQANSFSGLRRVLLKLYRENR